METITLPAALENLEKALDFIGAEDMEINIAVEEIFVNISNYAYADVGGTGDVTIRCGRQGDTLTIEFEDGGTPYNPLEKDDPADLDAETIAEKKVGGYGIYMVRQIMDEVSYRREDEKNILTISKNLGNYSPSYDENAQNHVGAPLAAPEAQNQ